MEGRATCAEFLPDFTTCTAYDAVLTAVGCECGGCCATVGNRRKLSGVLDEAQLRLAIASQLPDGTDFRVEPLSPYSAQVVILDDIAADENFASRVNVEYASVTGEIITLGAEVHGVAALVAPSPPRLSRSEAPKKENLREWRPHCVGAGPKL